LAAQEFREARRLPQHRFVTFAQDAEVVKARRALHKESDAAYFSRLARNYQNVFNPAMSFMTPRSADGAWVEPFDPKLGGGQGGRDYFTEVDSWIYTFGVQHDVAGLIRLFGGSDRINAKLDHLFVEQYGTSKYQFLNQFPDATGPSAK
jgi:putative alpha-1,2-mannosidase